MLVALRSQQALSVAVIQAHGKRLIADIRAGVAAACAEAERVCVEKLTALKAQQVEVEGSVNELRLLVAVGSQLVRDCSRTSVCQCRDHDSLMRSSSTHTAMLSATVTAAATTTPAVPSQSR